MLLKPAAVMALLAIAVPAQATDWYYVDMDDDGTFVHFIDRDSIRAESGKTFGTMFTVLTKSAQEDTVAYRIVQEIDCVAKKLRPYTMEGFAAGLVSQGVHTGKAEPWKPYEPNSYGASIADFICTLGNAEAGKSLGSEIPFEKGQQMLAEHNAK